MNALETQAAQAQSTSLLNEQKRLIAQAEQIAARLLIIANQLTALQPLLPAPAVAVASSPVVSGPPAA